MQTVPANLTRYGLSQIINHLLALDPARPFDFLINGELLRLSLHKHLAAKQLSTEAILEVEYVPAVLPPTPKEQEKHDDWVAAITVLSDAKKKAAPVIVSGCYDGIVRLWRGGASAGAFTAHQGPVKATAAGPSSNQLVTTGDDCVGRVWQWSSTIGKSAPELLAVLKGHTASVETAAVRPDGERCATAGWDGSVHVWRCGQALVDSAAAGGAAAAPKKRRTGTAGALPTGAHEEEAVRCLEGHSQCVAALAWPEDSTIVTGSWDHSVRVWDVEVGAAADSYLHNKAVHCVAAALEPANATLIAFGGPEKVLRLWDRRSGPAGEDGAVVRAFSSHADWISCIAWHPTSPHHLMSVSYDQTAKLWDLRASVPLHTIAGAEDRLLACAWVGSGEVAFGGADCMLRTAAVDVSGAAMAS